jgi:hypothetical protein
VHCTLQRYKMLLGDQNYSKCKAAMTHVHFLCIAGKMPCLFETASKCTIGESATPDDLLSKCLCSCKHHAQVHRTLHLQVPPRPTSLDKQQQQLQQQQQRRQSLESLESAGDGSQPLSPADQQADLFAAAKAGLVSSRQVPEGSAGFAWAKTRKGPRASHAGQQQQQAYVPHLAGTQVRQQLCAAALSCLIYTATASVSTTSMVWCLHMPATQPRCRRSLARVPQRHPSSLGCIPTCHRCC